jgi:hypothetical protein
VHRVLRTLLGQQIRRRRSFHRTCRSCTFTWTISRRLAKKRAPKGWRRAYRPADIAASGTRMLSNAHMTYLNAELRGRTAAANAELELIEQLRSCPRCGSKDYTQSKQ